MGCPVYSLFNNITAAVAAAVVVVVSMSPTVNIIEHKRSLNRPVAYLMCQSVYLSFSWESILWQNG